MMGRSTDRTVHPIHSIAEMRHGAANSRRLLVHTIDALNDFNDAVTVIGAHAVHFWVERAWGPTEMEATRDGDLVIDPAFVTDDPKLIDMMTAAGVTPALPDRPGIYGFANETGLEWKQRTTVDLIVPETYAGAGRRAARIPGQRNAASRALGLELAVWDRTFTKITTIDEPIESVEAYVAGPAALLVAKAHKVHERMADFSTRPHRLKPKDSGDVALLMMVSDPATVAETMRAACDAHPEIADVVASAATWIIEMYGASTAIPYQQAIDSLIARFDDQEIISVLESWTIAFQESLRSPTSHSHTLDECP
jgi:hypothetical protein